MLDRQLFVSRPLGSSCPTGLQRGAWPTVLDRKSNMFRLPESLG